MRISRIARFMQMNGAITGWREGIRWFRLPGRRTAVIGDVFGYRFIGRGGLRIARTVTAPKATTDRAGAARAPAGAGG